MYLHVGNNRNIRTKDIIGIFDADTATVSPVTKKYIAKQQEKKNIEFAAIELPKSFVLYCERKPRKRYRICFSQLSSASLAGRAVKPAKGKQYE